MSVIFITHDLGVVNMADNCRHVCGKSSNTALRMTFLRFEAPYTWALLSSMPDLDTDETPARFLNSAGI
ncbi:MAG: hypothetical protein ACLRSW_04675 [Christensenellaceae bacterium]